jgi:LuxR family glucitol operon transcriptional activator
LYADRIYYAQKAAAAATAMGVVEDAALFRIDGLGWPLTEEGRFEEAEQEINRGLREAETLELERADARDLIALAYAFLARLRLHQGAIAQASAWIAQAQPIDCRKVIRHRVTMVAGDIAYATGDYATAIRFFHEAIRLDEEFSEAEAVRYDLSQRLGFAYLAQRKLDEAKAAFIYLLANKGEAGTMESIYGNYGLGCVAAGEGDRARAHALAHEALSTLSRLNSRHRLIDQIKDFLTSLEAQAV